MADLARKAGIEPGEYMLGRLAHYVQEEDHEKAEALALSILPFVRRRLGAEPVPEVKQAAAEKRLIVVSAPASE